MHRKEESLLSCLEEMFGVEDSVPPPQLTRPLKVRSQVAYLMTGHQAHGLNRVQVLSAPSRHCVVQRHKKRPCSTSSAALPILPWDGAAACVPEAVGTSGDPPLLSLLTEPLLLRVFSFLSAEDLTAAAQSCRVFNQLASDDVLWSRLLLARWVLSQARWAASKSGCQGPCVHLTW